MKFSENPGNKGVGFGLYTRDGKASDDFERDWNAHKADLLAYAYRLTRNREDAEDLVQDTALLMLRFLTSSNAPVDNFRVLAFSVLRNRFLRLRAEQAGLSTVILDDDQADPRSDGIENLIAQLVQHDFLSDEEREIVSLQAMGLSLREIAVAKECSTKKPFNVLKKVQRRFAA